MSCHDMSFIYSFIHSLAKLFIEHLSQANTVFRLPAKQANKNTTGIGVLIMYCCITNHSKT